EEGPHEQSDPQQREEQEPRSAAPSVPGQQGCLHLQHLLFASDPSSALAGRVSSARRRLLDYSRRTRPFRSASSPRARAPGRTTRLTAEALDATVTSLALRLSPTLRTSEIGRSAFGPPSPLAADVDHRARADPGIMLHERWRELPGVDDGGGGFLPYPANRKR